MGQSDLVSALTIDCHTGLCFYGHPRLYRVQSTSLTVGQFPNISPTAIKCLDISGFSSQVVPLQISNFSDITICSGKQKQNLVGGGKATTTDITTGSALLESLCKAYHCKWRNAYFEPDSAANHVTAHSITD